MIIAIIIILVVFLFIIIKSGPKNNVSNGITRESLEFNMSEYPASYSFEVAGVHVDHYAHQIINYCKVNDFITLEPEPENRHDEDAILVKNSYREIGYVPGSETTEVHDIIQKNHIAYISKREIMSYIRVEITIRYSV